MNPYISKLIMLLLMSISNSIMSAGEHSNTETEPHAQAFIELESTNDQLPIDDDRAQVKIKEAKKKAETVVLDSTVDHAWGLLLGDSIEVRVDTHSLESGVDESSLPLANKRYGTWLYLKSIVIEVKQLVFHYQVTNVPAKTNRIIKTPAFDVQGNNGQWFFVSSSSITIGPALAVGAGLENIQIKEDIEPMFIATDALESTLKKYIIIAVLSSLLLVIWHIGWKRKNRDPFAQAVHNLGCLPWQHSVTDNHASRILHTAFNRTSNTIVAYGELDDLLEKAPWLASLQEDIQEFYQQSEQHFFARKAGQEPDIDFIRKLAKACRSKEMVA